MKLILCSTFLTKETKTNFETFIGRKTEGLKVACIITAAKGYKKLYGDMADLSFVENEIKFATDDLGFEVIQYDIETMSAQDKIDMFNCDGVWVEGGLTGYLINAVMDHNFYDILIRFAKEKFYIGTSAGSMITSKDLDASEWYIGEPEEGIDRYNGLGLTDFQIYPHYVEKDYDAICDASVPTNAYLLLKDGQAIAYEGKRDSEGREIYQVFGGKITVLEAILDFE
jgi:peptidase E